MTFTETSKGIWESTEQAYTAAMLNCDRQPIGIKESAARIVEADKNGKVVYRLYVAHLGGYRFEKSFKTLDKAINYMNK